MFNALLGKFSKDLGVDLGTTNTLVYTKDKGIIIHEPSVVAINERTGTILAVGQEARNMIGKTPRHIAAIRPLSKGVVSDFEVTEKMLKHFIEKIHRETFTILPRPRIVIGIPLGITEVERKAVEDAAFNAGARQVFVIEEPMAAAIGARLPVQDATGNMLVDIGGGTSDIAVISLGGIVNGRSLRLGGEEMNNNIIQYIRDQYNLLIGEASAEELKIKIGSAISRKDTMEATVRGRDLLTGLPKELTIANAQIREAINKSLRLLVDGIKSTLEETPPELTADIFERGITLTGGGALLKDIDQRISAEIQIPVHVVDDPLTTVVRGTGLILEDMSVIRDLILQENETEF